MIDFKDRVLAELVSSLNESDQSLAAWEGGSAATGTSDSYSDIDLLVIGKNSVEAVFEVIERALGRISCISHKHVESKNFWPGCFQRVYFLEGAPKYFFVDVAVLLESSREALSEFMQPERHGNPIIHFDKMNLVKPFPCDTVALKYRQLKRLEEIETAYPIYKLEVLKELDRYHPIDAFSFYFGGVLRPLVELMGMLHRPFRYDFGFRYLHKTFPEADQKTIEQLMYVQDTETLRDRMTEADRLFGEFISRIRNKLEQ